MDLYDVAIARKLSGGGGGGGGDFTTATVTFIGSGECSIDGGIVDMSSAFELPDGTLPEVVTHIESPGEGTITVVLYQGSALITLYDQASVSGAIEVEYAEYEIYRITGDCTIDFS